MGTKRILLAESNPLYRQAIADVLARIKDIALVGKVSTGWEAVRFSVQLNPDIVLIDFHLPGLTGLEATRLIKRRLTQVRIVILGEDEIKQNGDAAKQSGAWAYLAKSRMVQELPTLLIS